MDCKAAEDRLTLLADDDLPAQEALAVRGHLAECSECAATYRDVCRVSSWLRTLPPPAVPSALRRRIGMALDAAGEPQPTNRQSGRPPWETVAPYLAAAAVVVLALALASFLSPRQRGASRVARARPPALGAPTPAATTGPAQPAGTSPAGAEAPDPSTGSSLDESRAVKEAMTLIEELQKGRQIRERDEEILWGLPPPPDAIPEPGVVTITPHGEPDRGGKPPGTFAIESTASDSGPAQASPTPTVIDLRFVPPDDPAVGTSAPGVVEVSSRESIPQVVVSATGDEGLEIDKPGGVLYRGPLQAGEAVRVPLPMTASKAGSHEVNIEVTSDAPGGNTRLEVFVPSFRSVPAPRPQASPGDKPVSLVFKNVPIRQALMDIARQAKLRIEIPQGLGTERVSRDVRNVPAKAALRAVAEAGGYTVTEADGVYKVARSADASSD
jgi:hypothetical protein